MWEYKVYENFLAEDKFKFIRDKIVNDPKVPAANSGEIYRPWLDHDPTPEIADTFKDFDRHREFETLHPFIHYAVTPHHFVHKVHDEATFKIMSAILYVAPEYNVGTILHDKFENPTESIEVEWEPNTLMVFCGESNVTWHHYESFDQRFTYNYFLVDPSKIKDEEYKTYVIGEDLSTKLQK